MKKLLLLAVILLFSLSLASAVTVSNVELLELGEDGFVIGFETDVAIAGHIWFGKTGALGDFTPITTEKKTYHQVQVDGLEPGTVYFYRAAGKQPSGSGYYTGAISLTRTPQITGNSDSSNTDTTGSTNTGSTGGTTNTGSTGTTTSGTPTNPNAKLLFKSGFEGTTDVCTRSDNPSCSTSYACGVDSVIKGVDGAYNWPGDLPGRNAGNMIQDVIGSGCPGTKAACHTLDIINAPGPDGTPTKRTLL